MTEKELIRRTENKLKLYDLMKINYNNLTDDIKKLESKKERPSASIISVVPGGRSLNTDNFNLIKITETIEKKRLLQDKLGAEMAEVERAINEIRKENYFYIIDEYYFEDKTIQEIIDNHYISRVTFFNNRNRLLKKLSQILYPETFVELLLN